MSTLLTLVQPGTPWRGKYKACRGCSTTQQPELIDGHCADCFAAAFGPLGLDDVPPLGASVMATMTDDLPKIFQATRRLCFSCDQDKNEEEFSATQFYKKRPVCLSCEGHTPPLPIVPTPPPPAAAPATTDSLPLKRCARCRTHKGEFGFSASMWAESRSAGSRWCRDCERAYHDEYKARKQQLVSGPAAPAATAEPADQHAPAVNRTVADELRALLDSLARERAALLQQQEQLTARLAELGTQCDAVQTTLALVTR